MLTVFLIMKIFSCIFTEVHTESKSGNFYKSNNLLVHSHLNQAELLNVKKQINLYNVFDPPRHFFVLLGICMYMLGLLKQFLFYLNA